MKECEMRTAGLVGEEGLKRLHSSRIGIIGLGGVGGICAESLVRSGVGYLLLIDGDRIEPSNLNRQGLYDETMIGRFKAECAQERLAKLGFEPKLTAINEYLSLETIDKWALDKLDLIIDAIDDLDAKVALIAYCERHDIPLIISTGMANRFDSTQVRVGRLDQTSGDPLARKLRSMVRTQGLSLKVPCVYSLEIPQVHDRLPTSIMMVPSSGGLALASYALSFLLRKEINHGDD